MADEPRFPVGSQRIKVLVVDDDENLTSLVSRLLRGDADTTTARSGEEALAKLGTESYDAVLCDMSLMGMTGRDVWERLQQVDPELAEHLVFMSGGAVTNEDAAFFEALGARLVAKPFRRDDLLAAIRRFARR